MSLLATVPGGLRKVAFSNGATMFLRPFTHDDRIMDIRAEILAHKVILQNMTVETAAAWSVAQDLYRMPCAGTA